MTREHPNVLFLSVDALRADRASVMGYDRPTTPVMERLARDGVVWEQAVSDGAFTQQSFHSFMTSSRPLSHGGYDRGAVGRPRPLMKRFHDAGYETISLATFAWISRYFGYDGIDRECELFVLNALVGINGSGTMASTLRAWHREEISVDEATGRLEPLILKLFDNVESYCGRRREQSATDFLDLSHSRLMTEGYDYDGVLAVVARHRAEFLADGPGYVARHLTYVPRAHEWIARDWRYKRAWGKLAREAAFRAGNRLVDMASPRTALLRSFRYKRYLDGADLARRVVREIAERREPDKPFFLWTHFIDPHVPYCAGQGANWHARTPDYLAALGYPRDIDPAIAVGDKPATADEWAAWSAFYDAVVRYTDEQIGYVIDGLEAMGIADDTLVVLCGDHGEELGEHGDISHHFRLYDHNVRIPVVFHRPGMTPGRVTGLTTLMDLAPSIAECAGIEPDPEWRGKAFSDPEINKRDHVLLETFHGGSCLFDRRPPYFAIRTAKWKYMWKEYRDPTDRYSPEGPELYDLESDPMEQTNLYHPDHPLVPGFNKLIAERMAEIPEIGAERIERAFGGEGIRSTKEVGAR